MTYETIYDWSQKSGGTYAKRLRSRTPQDGEVLDILVQPLRNRQAAKKFFRKLPRRLHYSPRTIITDKLGIYAAARAEVLPDVKHIQDKRSNNRGENSHQPTRERRASSQPNTPPVSRNLWGDRNVLSSRPPFADSPELPGSQVPTFQTMERSGQIPVSRVNEFLHGNRRFGENSQLVPFSQLNRTMP